jgi:hypothetical protein
VVAHDDLVGALSPAHLLGRFEEVPVVLVTVELWMERLFIRLSAAQSERTRVHDDRWAREFEQYSGEVQVAAKRGERVRRQPPEQPGEILNRVPLMVSDDLGTSYRNTGCAAAGSGFEWRGEWRFEPGVPAPATVLTVRLDAPQADGRAYELLLQDLARPSLPS